jgi:hypothetical protein
MSQSLKDSRPAMAIFVYRGTGWTQLGTLPILTFYYANGNVGQPGQ